MAMQPFHLNPNLRSGEARSLEEGLRQRIIGQDEAIQAVVDLYQVYRAGLSSPGHPLGNLLFLGPTGAGKTRMVEATAEVLFGDPRAVIKVDCAEFQHSHEIAKLIGSPPGYLGHRETRPLINQDALDEHHTDNLKISFLVFDEIEKAADALWQLLLGILDKATLTLGDNRRVDLSNTMIFLTSNLGGREIMQMMSSRMGFAPTETTSELPRLDVKVGQTAAAAAKRNFSPEFMNRIDKVVVFHPLQSEQLDEIFDIELRMVQERVYQTAKTPFRFRVARPAKDFLLREGTDIKYGARHLKRAIEHHLTCPLASLLATEQVCLNDAILIDWNGTDDRLLFLKEAAGVLSDGSSQLPESKAQAAAASSEGREATLPVSSKGAAKSAAANGNVGSNFRLTKQRAGANSTMPATNVGNVRHITRPRK
jgi:ATP-dependent Clp protease ATP-binding subunit ClpA